MALGYLWYGLPRRICRSVFQLFTGQIDQLCRPQVASGFSGLSTVLVSWLLLAIWALDVQARRHSGLVILLLAGLTVVMIGVSQFSYAGIRLQQLVNFLIIMCLIFHTARYEIQLAPFTKVAILLVALMAFAFRMKNFADTAGIGSSPFVPYLFFWE